MTVILTALYVGFYGFLGAVGEPGYGYRYLLPLAPFWVMTLLLQPRIGSADGYLQRSVCY